MQRKIVIAAILLSLTACDGPSLSKKQRAEVETIAEDFADAAKSDVISNTEKTEVDARVSALEERLNRAESDNKFVLQQLKEINQGMAAMDRDNSQIRGR